MWERLLGEANADAVFTRWPGQGLMTPKNHQNEADQANRILPSILVALWPDLAMASFAHFSTDFVFPGDSTIPYPENARLPIPKRLRLNQACGRKGCAGRAAGKILRNTNSVVFRPRKKNFITSILDACNKRDMISVVDDQIGSPTYSLDLAFVGALSLLPAEKSGRYLERS